MLLFLLYSGDAPPLNVADNLPAKQIVALSEKIIAVFEDRGNFSCDVEVQYYRMAKEYKKYSFTWFWEKKGITRITFSRPYPGLTAIYREGDHGVTIRPFPFLPFITFSVSLYNARVRTPSGQRMDQTSIEYLSRFFYNNLSLIQQHAISFSEEADRVRCAFWAVDYTGGTELNRYCVLVSKDKWLPLRIERYNARNQPIEVISFKRFVWPTR
jgi:hypothetical protein